MVNGEMSKVVEHVETVNGELNELRNMNRNRVKLGIF